MGDVIFLKDDAADHSDAPTPKASVMTITGSDALILDEFMGYVSVRCYDSLYKGRGMLKTDALLKQLDRVREILGTMLDYPVLEQFYYNCPSLGLSREEAEPALQAATAERAELHFHEASVCMAPDGVPVGIIQLAVDDAAGEACGIAMIDRKTSPAAWTKVGPTVDDTIGIFVDAISFNDEDDGKPSA